MSTVDACLVERGCTVCVRVMTCHFKGRFWRLQDRFHPNLASAARLMYEGACGRTGRPRNQNDREKKSPISYDLRREEGVNRDDICHVFKRPKYKRRKECVPASLSHEVSGDRRELVAVAVGGVEGWRFGVLYG